MRVWIAILGLCLSAAGVQSSTAAKANDYPDRTVTLVVPYAAGSGMDAMSRVIGQQLSVRLKQNVVIDNKPGANGTIGTAFAARSAPNGYTIVMGNGGTHASSLSQFKSVPYDPIKDFVPISRVGSFFFMLAVNADIPARSMQELVDYAKGRPKELSYASANNTNVVVFERLKRLTGIDILQVPYRSMPQAVSDLVSKRVSMIMVDQGPAMPFLQAKTLRALAITSAERSPALPDVPSFREAGFPGLELDSWAGLFAPAGTPVEIVARLNNEVRHIVQESEVQARLSGLGFGTRASSSDELASAVAADIVRWRQLFKEAGIQPQ